MLFSSSPSLTFSLFFAYAYPPTPTVKLTLHILLYSPPPILPFPMCSTLILFVLCQLSHIHSYPLNLVSYSLPSMHVLLGLFLPLFLFLLVLSPTCISHSWSCAIPTTIFPTALPRCLLLEGEEKKSRRKRVGARECECNNRNRRAGVDAR